jgi:predicted nucleic acid-binding protein
MVIIDTDVLIKCLKKDEQHLNEVTELLQSKSAAITPVQLSEVYGHTLPEELPLVGAFFELFEFKQFNRKVSELAGEFLHQYKPYYPQLTISDCLVAAVAAEAEAEIYTLHPKHFPMTEVRLYHKTINALTAKSKPRLANTGLEADS